MNSNERIATGEERRLSEPLLQAVVAAGCMLGRYLDPHALIQGLLSETDALGEAYLPELLERAGLDGKPVTLSLNDIPADSGPVLLALNDGWALWRGRRDILRFESEGETPLTLRQLRQLYSGNAWVIYQPIRWQQQTAPASQPDGWFRQMLYSQSWIYAYALLATLMVNLFVLVVPFFTMAVYDRVIPSNAMTSLTALALGALAVLLFDFLVKNIRTYLIESAGRRIDNHLGVVVFARLMQLKSRSRTQPAGQLAATIKDYETLRNFMSGATITLLGDLPFAVLFIAVIAVVGGAMWIWPALGLATVVVLGLLLQIPLRRLVQAAQRDSIEKNVLLYESLDGLEALKILGAEGWSTQRWRQLIAVNSVNQDRYRRWIGLSQHSAGLIQMAVSIAVIVHGALLVAEGSVTSGVLIAALMLGNRAMSSSAHIASLLVTYHQASLSYAVVNGIMQAESEARPQDEQITKVRFQGDIQLQGVSFRYQPDMPDVFADIDLSISAGERIGILGRVGSGKSTLLKLIAGMVQPDTGRVLVDQLNVSALDLVALRRNIGCVQQESHLFSASLRTNVALRDLSGSDAAVLAAMQVVGLDQVVGQSAMGLDLPVGERGGHLSGGQRQLVCLARAFYGAPPILLLDEPTSQLDNSSEQRVLAGMRKAVAGKTLVLVTHRPSLLALVERLIVVDDGRIIADGPKQQVLDALNYQRGTASEAVRSDQSEGEQR